MNDEVEMDGELYPCELANRTQMKSSRLAVRFPLGRPEVNVTGMTYRKTDADSLLLEIGSSRRD